MSKIEAMTDKDGLPEHVVPPEPPADHFRNGRAWHDHGRAGSQRLCAGAEADPRFPKVSLRRSRSRSRISSPARPAMPRSASAWRRSSPTISSAAGCSRRSIQAAFIERITNIDTAPQFQSWKQIDAQALVTGRMTRQGDGRLKAEFRLWDVNTAAAAHRPAILHLAGILAADRAHHLRPDLRAR